MRGYGEGGLVDQGGGYAGADPPTPVATTLVGIFLARRRSLQVARGAGRCRAAPAQVAPRGAHGGAACG